MIIFNEKKLYEYLKKNLDICFESVFTILDSQQQKIENLQNEVESLKRIIDYTTQYNIEQNKKYQKGK